MFCIEFLVGSLLSSSSVCEREKVLVFSRLVQNSKHEKSSEKLLVCDFLTLLSHTQRAQKVWMTVWIFVVS